LAVTRLTNPSNVAVPTPEAVAVRNTVVFHEATPVDVPAPVRVR